MAMRRMFNCLGDDHALLVCGFARAVARHQPACHTGSPGLVYKRFAVIPRPSVYNAAAHTVKVCTARRWPGSSVAHRLLTAFPLRG
jgi:hypothetical protein